MRTILVLNDHSFEAEHAAKLALNLAKKCHANILLWSTNISEDAPVKEFVTSINKSETVKSINKRKSLADSLIAQASTFNGYTPDINCINTFNFSGIHLVDIILKNNIWMVVKGVAETNRIKPGFLYDEVQSVLSKAGCPLLLVPQKAKIKHIERLVYTADLRYCCLDVIGFVTQLAKPHNADVLVAHISAKGLPDMADSYAASLFKNEISFNIKYENLMFNNIKEKDVQKAVDILVDVMHTDMLVLVNHKFHFEEVLNQSASRNLPDYLHIPLLIFPS